MESEAPPSAFEETGFFALLSKKGLYRVFPVVMLGPNFFVRFAGKRGPSEVCAKLNSTMTSNDWNIEKIYAGPTVRAGLSIQIIGIKWQLVNEGAQDGAS